MLGPVIMAGNYSQRDDPLLRASERLEPPAKENAVRLCSPLWAGGRSTEKQQFPRGVPVLRALCFHCSRGEGAFKCSVGL